MASDMENSRKERISSGSYFEKEMHQDKFRRDLDFRKRMLEHGRDEDVCLHWDDLAEQDFTYRMSE